MTSLDRLQRIIKKHNNFENERKIIDNSKIYKNVKLWTTYYRRNWDIYAKEQLGLALKPFQDVVFYQIGVSTTYFFFCARGASKSWMAAGAMVTMCMLYPHSEIVITATTLNTAKKFVYNKIENEICTKNSPYLKYLKDNKYITFKYTNDEIRVTFEFNHSWICVLPEQEGSSLGERVTGLCFEEARKAKLNVVDRVFLPMRHARQPAFKSYNPKYADDERLTEQSKTIYLTSMSYKFEPIWNRWVKTVEKYFNITNMKLGVYNILAIDVYTSLYHEFLSVSEYYDAKNTSSGLEFELEYLNHSPSMLDDSFYDLQLMISRATNSDAFVPPSYVQWFYDYNRGEKPFFRNKVEGEIRTISIDFAFVDSIRDENDLTVIELISGQPNKERTKMMRKIDFVETFSGGDRINTLIRIRELFLWYDADYIIVDTRNGGVERIMELTSPYYHKDLDIHFNGFGFCEDEEITRYYYNRDKINALMMRVIDPDPIKCIIPVAATDERNDNFHRQFRNALFDNKIELLKQSSDIREELDDGGVLIKFNSEELARRLLPHVQTELLIQEAVQLKRSLIKNGLIKLSETGSNTKDRIVTAEYGNYLFYILEQRMLKINNLDDDDFDFDDIQLVF